MYQNIMQCLVQIREIYTPFGRHIELGGYIYWLINAKRLKK